MITNNLNDIKEALVDAGLKATHPRLVVFSELLESKDHPTAEQLFDRIREQNPGIAKGSVYRILDHLSEAGLVNQVSSKQGLKRYDPNVGQHNHIYCVKTHEIMDFESVELDQLLKEYFEKRELRNFKITDIKLQINGEKVDPSKEVKIV